MIRLLVAVLILVAVFYAGAFTEANLDQENPL